MRDTSEHDWLEGRGEESLYLIHMIDDATSELTARFVSQRLHRGEHAAAVELLPGTARAAAGVLHRQSQSMFQTAPKTARDAQAGRATNAKQLPPTQIGRALRELGIVWIAAHSPQAKGRVERSFGTAQDRLVKGLRVAGASTLEEANRYLEEEFRAVVESASGGGAGQRRPMRTGRWAKSTIWRRSLSQVETRQVANDYTLRWTASPYRIARSTICAGLRGATVRIERRLDGSLAVRFRRPLPDTAAKYAPSGETPPSRLIDAPSLPRKPRREAGVARNNFGQTRTSRYGRPAQIDGTRTIDQLGGVEVNPERRAKAARRSVALDLSEDRCSEASPKQTPVRTKTKTPRTGSG